MAGTTVYEQLETSPETIGQELRAAVCERQQTDRFKENYSIDDRLARSLLFATIVHTCTEKY